MRRDRRGSSLASNNPGKLREIRRLLEPLGIDVIAQAELGIPEADEPHVTFVENALAKARHASARADLPALADDSGICVRCARRRAGRAQRALCGRRRHPTRATTRRSSPRCPASPIGARITTACSCSCATPTIREPIIAEGAWHGTIIDAPRGDGGFGYDPHFLDDVTGLTGAELPLARKNALSHRGKAMRA